MPKRNPLLDKLEALTEAVLILAEAVQFNTQAILAGGEEDAEEEEEEQTGGNWHL